MSLGTIIGFKGLGGSGGVNIGTTVECKGFGFRGSGGVNIGTNVGFKTFGFSAQGSGCRF